MLDLYSWQATKLPHDLEGMKATNRQIVPNVHNRLNLDCMASAHRVPPKKDEALHLVIDIKNLNVVTVRDVYLLSRKDQYIDSLGDGRVF